MNKLLQHKAKLEDLPSIIALLIEDDLGQHRELQGAQLDPRYVDAFNRIDTDPNQYLMVVTSTKEIVGTCHLTLMPSLTFIGSMRLQIEAVHVAAKHRGQKIGEWMMNAAFEFAKSNNASIIQLTTNKQRTRAKQFYERLGFEATHEGMKKYLSHKR
jgi:ribosomal protein S18 acetylase RimI-like enzyme